MKIRRFARKADGAPHWQVIGFAICFTVAPAWGPAPATAASLLSDEAEPIAPEAQSPPPDDAAPISEPPTGDLGEELLLFAEMPIVISATRRAVPINLSPTPTSIITDQDIHYSGLTRIDELLQFVPGVDSLQADRNRVSVGVRGLHDFTSDRTLSLINGRAASNPSFGGTEFSRQPLFVHDIERIEVVRGPGGAAWGANAFNGVINIITKKPRDVQGLLLSSQVSVYGDLYSQMRWADAFGDTSVRLSLGYESHRSSQQVLNGPDVSVMEEYGPLFAGADLSPRDFNRSPAIDAELVHEFSPDTTLTVGAGYRHVERGDYEFVGHFPRRNERLDTLRTFAKLETKFDSGATAYLQYFANYLRSEQPSQLDSTAFENDIEAQFNLSDWNNHAITLGGNFRFTHLTTDAYDVQPISHDRSSVDEYWVGLFLIDRWEVTDRFTLEGQLRGDYYSETHGDWSGRFTGLFALDDEKQHVLRVSGARAFRAPLSGFRRLQVRRLQTGPDLYFVNVDPGSDLRNEHIWSLEGGYSGQLADAVSLRLDVYWQRYGDLIGLREQGDPLGLGRQFFEVDNIDGATAYGLEAEIAYTGERGRVSAWYSFNEFEADQSQQDVRALLPARHKAGVSGRLFLPNDWALNLNYKWSDTTRYNPSAGGKVENFHRVDLAVAKAFASGRGEIMAGVTDVFDQTSIDVFSLGDLTSHPTPGRSVFVRVQLKF